MPHSLEQKLAVAWPPADWADMTVLAAVSGGGDSVAMLRAMKAVKADGPGRIVVAHLNHRLRPEADADERFVVDLCRQLNVPCEVERVDVRNIAATSGDGIEAAARRARYQFLERAAGQCGARFVVTAHTADDQAETILHRILRGTGVRGLAGIARTRPLGHASLLRPLLGIRHAELLAYLESLGQPYCHDRSNLDPRFTRNRIRLRLLPRLQRQFNPEVVDALLRLGGLAGDAQSLVDELVAECFQRCVTIEGLGTVKIDLALLSNRPRHLIRELLMAVWRRMDWPLQAMSHEKWEELSSLAITATPSSPRHFPGGVSVEVVEGIMVLVPTK